MHKISKSVIKTIFTVEKQENYTRQCCYYRYMSVVRQLLFKADEHCRKDALDPIKSSHTNIRCVSPKHIVDTIQQYDGIKKSLFNSVISMQRIGESRYKNNRYSLNHTSIVYPDHWCPQSVPSYCSLHQTTSKKPTEQILKNWYTSALGSSLPSSMKETLWQLKPAEWSVLLLPYAGNNYTELMGQFLAIWVLMDDYLIEGDAVNQQKITLEQLLIFAKIWKLSFQRQKGNLQASQHLAKEIQNIASDTNLNLLEPCFHLWSSIADNYIKLGADEVWCNRMSDAIEKWIVLGVRETMINENIQQQSSSSSLTNLLKSISVTLMSNDDSISQQTTNIDTNDVSLLEVLMQQRINTIGVPMLALLLEQSYGLNLSSVDSLLHPLIDIISIITITVNELYGLAKDLRGEPNFSLAYRQIFNCSLEESIDFTIKLHDLAIKTFDEKSKDILKSLEFSDLKDDVSNFIESLRVLARGYAHWHSNADRYKTLMALDETSRELFLFSVADGANQRYDALQHTLQQYKLYTINNNICN